jgi:hypothetical protein
MEKISGTDRMKNEDVLHQLKRKGISCIKQKKRKADWIGHILHKNCLCGTLLKER